MVYRRNIDQKVNNSNSNSVKIDLFSNRKVAHLGRSRNRDDFTLEYIKSLSMEENSQYDTGEKLLADYKAWGERNTDPLSIKQSFLADKQSLKLMSKALGIDEEEIKK